MNRETFISIRVNSEELETIKNKMERLGINSRSQYIRQMILYGFIVNRDESCMEDLLNKYSLVNNELKVIGRNLNQISKRLSRGENIYGDDLADIKNNLNQINEKIENELYKAIKKVDEEEQNLFQL